MPGFSEATFVFKLILNFSKLNHSTTEKCSVKPLLKQCCKASIKHGFRISPQSKRENVNKKHYGISPPRSPFLQPSTWCYNIDQNYLRELAIGIFCEFIFKRLKERLNLQCYKVTVFKLRSMSYIKQ